MRFKVGDKVRVRHGLKHGDSYGDIYCNEIMSKMGGEVLTIENVRHDYYDIEENGWYWSDEMLEPVDENTKEDKIMSKFKVGDKVKVKSGLVRDEIRQGVNVNGVMEDLSNIGKILTILEVRAGVIYHVEENELTWSEDMLEPAKETIKKSKALCEIADYKYNHETGETYIKWTDKTETRVRPAEGTKPNQYVGFVTAYAKKAAGNTSRINNLFDKWTIKKPLKDKIEKEKQAATKAEAKRIAAKRKAKREKWLLRREVLRRKRAYEAAQLAQKEYGVPVDFNEEK